MTPGSFYYQDYVGPEFETSNSAKASKHSIKISSNNKKTRAVKTTIDGIDAHLLSSLRPHITPPPPISDAEYNRLHDMCFDTDLAFRAGLLERWRVRVGRLAPWSAQEQSSLLKRWFARVGHWTAEERKLFIDPSLNTTGVKLPAVPANEAAPTERSTKSVHKDNTVNEGDLTGQTEDGINDVGAFRNSDGLYDSTRCPELIKAWETHANRIRPFPRAVADKLLTAWVGHESAWTPYERAIFHAGHDPTAERESQISADEKHLLLDLLVARNEFGEEPLLNGRYVRGKEPEPTPDDGADEVFATPLDVETEPMTTEYEKELKRLLAANTEADKCQCAETIMAAIRRGDARVIRMTESKRTINATILRESLLPNSSIGLNFDSSGCA